MTRNELHIIAQETARILFDMLQGTECSQDEMLTAKQAAEHLGVTTRWMADNKDRFRYVKTGANGGGRLLFLKSSLKKGVSA